MKLFRLIPFVTVFAACLASRPLSAADPTPIKKNGYTATVDVLVDEKGKAETVKLVSTDDPNAGDVLAKMAIVMAAKIDFPPRMKDGKPHKYTVRAPFFFPIDDDEGPQSDTAPKPRVKYGTAVQPVYPLSLRDNDVAGGAILELVVDAQGKLSSVKCLRASHPEFETAALDCIKKWQFVAAQKDGQPVESRTRFAFVFETARTTADLKWRIVPRPRLGSLIVIKPEHPITDEEMGVANPNGAAAPAAAAPAKDAPAAAPAEPAKDAPAVTFPAPAPAPAK